MLLSLLNKLVTKLSLYDQSHYDILGFLGLDSDMPQHTLFILVASSFWYH